jgi:hypothetical protein
MYASKRAQSILFSLRRMPAQPSPFPSLLPLRPRPRPGPPGARTVEPAAMAGKRDDEHKIGPSRWLLCWTAAGGSRVRLAVRNASHPFQDARDSRRTASLLLAPSGLIINADEGGLPARDGSAREGGHGTAGWLAGCLLLFACMLFVLPRCSRRHAAGCWLAATLLPLSGAGVLWPFRGWSCAGR